MKRTRITLKRYEKVVATDEMPSRRDANIQVYNGSKSVYFNDKLKIAQLVTL